MLFFSNGTAHFDLAQVGTDIDEMGMPIAGGSFILSAPCYIEASGESRAKKNDEGYYPNGSYSISLDYGAIGKDFNPMKVRLEHKHKGDLGTFTIQRIEFYDITRTVQVWV